MAKAFDWKEFARELFGKDGPELRCMEARDLDEVLRIIRLHDSDDYEAASVSYSSYDFSSGDAERGNFVICEPDEGRVVGVSGYYIDDLESQGIYWLGWTYVNPFFQGGGYGARLLHFVMRSLRNYAARKLYLSTSSLEKYETAIGFYERFGFIQEATLRDYYREGEDQLIFAVTL